MNNLADGIKTQMKIEQGLRILQFGSQYLIRRAYLRNCPLNDGIGDKNDHKGLQEKAQIIAELNQYLCYPQSASKYQGKGVKDKIGKSNIPHGDGKSKDGFFESIVNTAGHHRQVKKEKISNLRKNNEQQQRDLRSNEKVENKQKQVYYSKNAIEKDKPAAKITKSSRKREEQNTQINIPIDEQSSDEDNPYLGDEDEQNENQMKITGQINEDEIASYYSDTKQLPMIKQVSHQQSIPSNIIPQKLEQKVSKDKSQYYNLQDFHSIDKGSPNNSISVMMIKNKHQSQIGFQYPSQDSLKMSKKLSSPQSSAKQMTKSFLNKSISQIKSSKSSNSGIFSQKGDQTELNILREIADSYTDDQNMQNLLKLQNYEMQEKFLLQQMEKRFQNCSKQIEKIRNISWRSLKMPKQQLHFKRPNYAHCYQILK